MSKTVTFTADVYPYCVGDVIVLNDEELKQVDAIAKARKVKVYQDGAAGQVPSTDEADRNAAAKQKSADKAEGNAKAKLAAAVTAEADAEGHNSPSGGTAPGTAADTEVKTAAAK